MDAEGAVPEAGGGDARGRVGDVPGVPGLGELVAVVHVRAGVVEDLERVGLVVGVEVDGELVPARGLLLGEARGLSLIHI